jgi:hypothetical protein
VGPGAPDGDRGPQRALAAALNYAAARFEEDGEVGGQQFRRLARKQVQAVAGGVDFLALVEHVGHVAVGCGQAGGESQLDRHPRLHVRGADPGQPSPFCIPLGREVVGVRHRVDVTSQHHSFFSSASRTRDQGVPVAGQLKVRQRTQRALDRVGQRSLIAADR